MMGIEGAVFGKNQGREFEGGSYFGVFS